LDRYELKRAAQAGITLVELLVVLVILALASSTVLLNAPPSRTPVQEEAERLSARLRLALDEAQVTGRSLRAVFDATGYGFEVYRSGKWAALADHRFLSRHDFHPGVTPEVLVEEAAIANASALGEYARPGIPDDISRLTLDPMGAQSNLRVRLLSRDGAWVVELDPNGALESHRDQ
jgi:general secretion pathway protein H